jgi:phosphoenolpyruvate phosphomutase
MPLTQRNIAIDSEIWLKLKTEAIERNKNVREFAGEILTDYVKGRILNKKEKGRGEGEIKAIILAAGMSPRMMELTKDKPKCMLKIRGKTILQKQIETFHECGIEEIIVVKGYKKEKINYSGVKYIINRNYKEDNTLESLMCAEHEMNTGFIVTYSDIIFEKNIVKKLLEYKEEDIVLAVGIDWTSHYKDRFQHPIEEAEKVIVNRDKVTKIAKAINPNEAHGEFIGMALFSERGSKILKKNYKIAKKEFKNKPFHTAVSIERADIIDMIQELIDKHYDISYIDIDGGWTEIDTMEDYKKALK